MSCLKIQYRGKDDNFYTSLVFTQVIFLFKDFTDQVYFLVMYQINMQISFVAVLI